LFGQFGSGTVQDIEHIVARQIGALRRRYVGARPLSTVITTQDGIDFFEPTTAGIAVGYRWFFLDGGQTTLLRQIGYATNWRFRAKAVWVSANKPTDMAYRF
jgi:hypothetical protein